MLTPQGEKMADLKARSPRYNIYNNRMMEPLRENVSDIEAQQGSSSQTTTMTAGYEVPR